VEETARPGQETPRPETAGEAEEAIPPAHLLTATMQTLLHLLLVAHE
jgi:hypothetical protein